MRNKVILVGMGIFLVLVSCLYAQQPVGGAEEKITISTYYPSPYGVYKTLRLFPSDDNAPGGACENAGELYFDNSEQSVFVCKNGTWQEMPGDLTWFNGAAIPLKRGTTAHIEYKACGGGLLEVAEAKKDMDGKVYTRVYAKPLPVTPGIGSGMFDGTEVKAFYADPVCNCDSGWQEGLKAECNTGACWINVKAVVTTAGLVLDALPACCSHALTPGVRGTLAPWGSNLAVPAQKCVTGTRGGGLSGPAIGCEECGQSQAQTSDYIY